ncbi:MAG: hypothetical protein ABIG89_04875 [Candidatus Woesearchaeota archaeon]
MIYNKLCVIGYALLGAYSFISGNASADEINHNTREMIGTLEETLLNTPKTHHDRWLSLGLALHLTQTPESDGITDYLEPDRTTFNKSMPIGDDHTAFGRFLELGEIRPTFEINVNANLFDALKIHGLPRDGLNIGTYFGFGTSHIFGGLDNEQTFDAEIEHPLLSEPAQLGKTPTTWHQFLDYVITFGLDVQYNPHRVHFTWFGTDGEFNFGVGVKGGLFYIKTSSKLDIYVESEGPFTGKLFNGDELTLNWEQMNFIANTYKNIVTEATTYGWGGELHPFLVAGLRWGDVELLARFGRQWQFQPELKIDKTSRYDQTDRIYRVDKDGKPTGKTEKPDIVKVNNDTNGWAGSVTLRYYVF